MNDMSEQSEIRVRGLALKKGLYLVPSSQSTEASGVGARYELVIPEVGLRVFPQGAGAEGAPLHEIEDWLGFPWE